MLESNPSSTALLVIDVQRQFTEPDGVFPVAGMDEIVDKTVAFAALARAKGAPVIWVQQSMRPQVGLGRATQRYGRSDAHQGPGIELDPRLNPLPEDILLVKWRQSAFYMTDLDLMLRRLGVDRVLIAGITTNVCVIATAKDASERDYETIVLHDLTAALPITQGPEGGLTAEQVQKAGLAFIQYAYGDVRNTGEIDWDQR